MSLHNLPAIYSTCFFFTFKLFFIVNNSIFIFIVLLCILISCGNISFHVGFCVDFLFISLLIFFVSIWKDKFTYVEKYICMLVCLFALMDTSHLVKRMLQDFVFCPLAMYEVFNKQFKKIDSHARTFCICELCTCVYIHKYVCIHMYVWL